MAKANSTSRQRAANRAMPAQSPASPAAGTAERTYTQTEVWHLLGAALQCEVGDALRAIYQIAWNARVGNGAAQEAALLVAERFSRGAFVALDDALVAIGFDRMGYFGNKAETPLGGAR